MNTRRLFVAGIALAASCGWGVVANSRGAEAPLLVSMEVRGISTLVRDVNRVALGLQLGPQGGLLAQSLDRTMGGGNFAGIDTNATLRVYVFGDAPGKLPSRAKPIVLMLPTHDGGRTFLNALTNRFLRTAESNDMARYSQPANAPYAGPDLHVGKKLGYVVLGEDRELVGDVIQGMTAGKYTPTQRIGVPGTLAINCNMSALVPLMQKQVEKAGAAMKPGAKAGPAGSNPAEILKAESHFLLSLLSQMDAFQFGIGTEPQNVVMYSRIVAKPETQLAHINQSMHPARRDFLSVLPEDFMFATVGNLGDPDAFLNLYADFAQQVAGAMGPSGAAMRQLLTQSLTDMKGLNTGDYAAAFGFQQEPLRLRYVGCFGVTDPKRAQAVIDRYAAQFSGTNAIAGPGVQVRVVPGAGRSYKGIPIAAYGYACAMDPALLPGSNVPMPSLMSMMTNLHYEVAFNGNVGVAVLNDSALMDATLDRLQTPGASILNSRMFKTLFPGEPAAAQAVSVANVSLVEYMKFVLGMLPGVDAQSLAMIPASGSGLSGYTVTKGNTELGVAKLGIPEIAALKSMVPFLMMGAMSHPAHGPGGAARPPMQAPAGMPPPGPATQM